MYVLKDNVEHEIEINKSRFLCRLIISNNVDDVKIHLNAIKKAHRDASHNCSAFVLGEHGEYGGSNDDGEPSKTAGSPMLDVLRKNKVTKVLAVVTRYFGGIKLGAGGLIRAYSRCVSEAIQKADLIPLVKTSHLLIRIPYAHWDRVEHSLHQYVLENKTFGTDVSFEISIKSEDLETFMLFLFNLTNGMVRFTEL